MMTTRLTDLNPRWAADADIMLGGHLVHDEDRHGMAVTFDCPCCRKTRLGVWFSNPIDGKAATDDASHLWQRSGTTFDDLTLTPSIDASAHGHWHGFITVGEAR